MGEIKEPGPLPFIAIDSTVRFLREAEHQLANRSKEVRQRLLTSIQKIEAEAATLPVTGLEDASENLDKYLY